MTIANDAWIRKMAKEHGMITPFEEGLVTKGKISFGVSSYGYDVRVGSHYKIFHNLNSTLVDPKAFDAKSFVDHDGPECIIPPNSFVLAETVERFRIPRDVLCVCLGKCVSASTRVVDAETGEWLSIAEFAGRRATIGLDGWCARPLEVSDFIPQGKKPVLELKTRLGLSIKATANHPFRTFRGWTALEDFRPGDRIASARYVPIFGRTPLPEWEAVLLGLMISEGCCGSDTTPDFTNSDPVLVDLLRSSAVEGLACEISFNGIMAYRLRNPRGEPRQRNRARLWLESHGIAVKSNRKSVPPAVFKAPREGVATFLRALFSGDGSIYRSGDGVFFEYASMSRRLVEDVRHLLLRFGIVSLLRSKTTKYGTIAHKVQITDRDTLLRLLDEIGFWPGSEKQIRAETEILPDLRARGSRKSNFDTLPNEAWETVRSAAVDSSMTAREAGVPCLRSSQSVPLRDVRQVALATGDEELSELADVGPVWDVVESITPAGEEEVYDLTVPGHSNFLANDLFVHNSTYARCFTGDTRVALVEGGSATFEDLAARHARGETFLGYALDGAGRVVVARLEQPRWIARDALLELTLETGSTIRCTPDHAFVRRDGSFAQAHELRPGDSLMPLYREHGAADAVHQPDGEGATSLARLVADWEERNPLQRWAAPARWSLADVQPRPLHARNHRVISVRDLSGLHDVFCLTVPEAGNFALDAGVFVRNCGIIVNVTPLEPEWEGVVTIEISNTTPLPAKIYSNEGIAQILFLRAGPDGVCETSYADRKGKYQAQKGLTLPKVL
jgi:deoxycytidine triphosphate deaminase